MKLPDIDFDTAPADLVTRWASTTDENELELLKLESFILRVVREELKRTKLGGCQ